MDTFAQLLATALQRSSSVLSVSVSMLVAKMLMVSLVVLLLSFMANSLIIPQLTGAGTLTLTLPTLTSLTQAQLVALTAGGLSLGAAAGLAGLAVASSLLADGAGGGGGGGYGAPSSGYGAPSHGYSAPSSGYSAPSSGYSAPSSGYSAPSSGYSAPSSGYSAPSSGHGHSRAAIKIPTNVDQSFTKFTYEWQENIAKLRSRGKRDVSAQIDTFIEVK